MADVTPAQAEGGALDRIDRALARIEAAAAARATSSASLARRHATLRRCMADAVAALDAVLAAGDR